MKTFSEIERHEITVGRRATFLAQNTDPELIGWVEITNNHPDHTLYYEQLHFARVYQGRIVSPRLTTDVALMPGIKIYGVCRKGTISVHVTDVRYGGSSVEKGKRDVKKPAPKSERDPSQVGYGREWP